MNPLIKPLGYTDSKSGSEEKTLTVSPDQGGMGETATSIPLAEDNPFHFSTGDEVQEMSDEEYQEMVSYYNKLVEEMPCLIVDPENYAPNPFFINYIQYHPDGSITPILPLGQKRLWGKHSNKTWQTCARHVSCH